nr:putative reverse transcriptase domain-containing protein [Tanacetum cinerariifolium]
MEYQSQSFVTMTLAASFEALYGRKCRSPVVGLKSESPNSPVQKLFMRQLKRLYNKAEDLSCSRSVYLTSRWQFRWMKYTFMKKELHFVEESVEIMDREVTRLKKSRIIIIKVQWNSRRGPEFTWEGEDQFREKYPQPFTTAAPSTNTAS